MSLPELVFIDIPGITVRKERKLPQSIPKLLTDPDSRLGKLQSTFCSRWGVVTPDEITRVNPQAMDEWLEMVEEARNERWGIGL